MDNKVVVVVEDNEDNLKLVSWILEDENYEFVSFKSGEECLENIDKYNVALILMDISLPGMDGKEATRRLRDIDKYSQLPIIACTAHAIKGEEEEIRDCGVDDIITKPIDENMLIERLKQLFSN